MKSIPPTGWLALGAAVLAAAAGCTSAPRISEPAIAEGARNPANEPAPPCEEQRVPAKLIVLAVDALEEATARRIESTLAEKYSAGIVSAVADARTQLVTIVARADADITVASMLELFQTLGVNAREANEAEYQAAEADLSSRILSIPVADGAEDRPPVKDRTAAPSLQSLGESLTPLRSRFNSDKGKLRFIALLSPT